MHGSNFEFGAVTARRWETFSEPLQVISPFRNWACSDRHVCSREELAIPSEFLRRIRAREIAASGLSVAVVVKSNGSLAAQFLRGEGGGGGEGLNATLGVQSQDFSQACAWAHNLRAPRSKEIHSEIRR